MCRLEAMRAAQFSSRGATPHEEQALLKQAKALAAQQETSQPASGSRGKGSRGRGPGRAAARDGPESPQPTHAASKSTQPSQGITCLPRCMCRLDKKSIKLMPKVQAHRIGVGQSQLQMHM